MGLTPPFSALILGQIERFMDFKLSETHEDVRKLARELCEKELRPIVLELDKKHKYPGKFLKLLGELGFMGIWLPEEYGGLGQGVLSLALTAEEIARVCTGTSAAYSDIALGALAILLGGTEEQKKKYLTRIAAGECIPPFALTEASSGSDAFAMRTRAVKDGEFYVLNGVKQFITNAGKADICILFAMTNPQKGPRGASGFIIEKGTPGFSAGPQWKKAGLHCSDTRNVILSDCRVPKENLLCGKEGEAVITIMNTFYRSRIVVAAQGVGCAQGAYEAAWAYASQTERFGQKILSFQATKHRFANMTMKIENARNLVYKAAWLADSGVETKGKRRELAKLSSMAKCYASDIASEVADDAVITCGGTGYMQEAGIEKYWRDAMALRLYEGTNPIQLNEIAQILIQESVQK